MRDELLIRGRVPMTKSEVRAVSLSKLELGQNSILYDVGAGTGSVSVEAALAMPQGRVYGIEKEDAALELMEKNKRKFKTRNWTIVQGEAPEVFEGLEAPTHAFVGGTSGRMEEVLSSLWELNPSVRVVVNAVTVETVAAVTGWLRARGLEAEIVTVTVAKAELTGNRHLMRGQNPVTVISFGGGS